MAMPSTDREVSTSAYGDGELAEIGATPALIPTKARVDVVATQRRRT